MSSDGCLLDASETRSSPSQSRAVDDPVKGSNCFAGGWSIVAGWKQTSSRHL